MKQKTKVQKGITLIALIITIVVLLILAAVVIANIINDGVLGYAENAATQYNQAVKNEKDTLQGYMDYLNKHNGGSGSSDGEENGSGDESSSENGNKEDSKVGIIFTENGTINGEIYSATNPIIPAGFMPINTETSKWDEGKLANNVKNGLVISDGTNEFVWVPVEDINDMAKVTSGVDANGRTNYQGVLYNFSNISATKKINYCGQGTTGYREPANLNSDSTTNLSIWTKNLYQESFNKMVESVAKYKGFYVGRYEMSLDSNGKAQSKAGETSATAKEDSANMWFGLYEKATTYSNSGVVSEMIWGCQYDAILRWMQGNYIDVMSSEPIDTARGVTATYNKTITTGADDSNDILNNVYDLLGNRGELTQEALGTDSRVDRGHSYGDITSPSDRGDSDDPKPTKSGGWGSRLTLYIENIAGSNEEFGSNTGIVAKIIDANGNNIVGKVVISNTEAWDEYGNKIVVPAGFKIRVDEGKRTKGDEKSLATNVTEGIVIEDEDGNQFVWIPVGTIYTNVEKTKSKTITLGRYQYKIHYDDELESIVVDVNNYISNNGVYMPTQRAEDYATKMIIGDYYTEDTVENHNSSYGNAIARNIGDFVTSTLQNGGYYIGRFEAGKENNILVCKSGQTVYGNITQQDASRESRNMYNNGYKTGTFSSDLINSYAWDTAIIFIQTFAGGYITKYYNQSYCTSFTITGENGDEFCNINDMSGNAHEWSTETYESYDSNSVTRSGSYNEDVGNTGTASSRQGGYEYSFENFDHSFRPILYVSL